MVHKLVIEVFRFDSKVDYLPYYKKVTIEIDAKKSVADLLALIKDDESSFGYPTGENAAIRIDSKAIFTNEKIEDIREFFGEQWQLDPLSSKHSTKDLIINTEDFEAKLELFDAFVDSDDKEVYRSYIREHYTSPIVNLEEDFIGDGLFAFAYDMVQKYPDRRVEILESIAQKESGVWLHVNISNKLYPVNSELERKVVYLKNAIINEPSIVNNFVNAQRAISGGF